MTSFGSILELCVPSDRPAAMASTTSTTDTYRLGCDVGGTFTDACAFSPKGRIFRAKVPSTPHDQSIGVKNSIDKIRSIIQAEENDFGGKFGSLHHGSTVATNALLEGKGVPAALIVTEGHKDGKCLASKPHLTHPCWE